MSLSKTFHLNCFAMIQPRKMSRHDCKIVDWDVKPQPKQKKIVVQPFNFTNEKVNTGFYSVTNVCPHLHLNDTVKLGNSADIVTEKQMIFCNLQY